MNVIRQIKNHQLGSLEEEYTNKKGIIVICITLAVLGVISFLLTLFFSHSLSDSFSVVPVWPLLIGIAILVKGDIQVYLCTEGLLYVRWGASESIHWKSIYQVQRRTVHQANNASPSPTISYTDITNLIIFSRNHPSCPFISFPEIDDGLSDALRARGTRHGFQVIETKV